jgi:hypothetical protein
MYQLLPLSARMIPYFFIAVRITSVGPENELVANDAFRRRRSPIGGRVVLEFPAACVAG